MQTHQIIVDKLVGFPLAWAVAQARGLEVVIAPPAYNGVPARPFLVHRGQVGVWQELYDPANDWKQCGPLLDEYHIEFVMQLNGKICASAYLSDQAISDGPFGQASDPDRRLAALRAIVKGHIGRGNYAQIPDEIWQSYLLAFEAAKADNKRQVE